MRLGSLLFPVRVVVLLALHLAFALYRLAKLVSRVASTRPGRVNPPRDAPVSDSDQARWEKTPKHLAVLFVPSKPAWRRSARGSEAAELEKLVEDLKLLLAWCEQLSVESLSVYDEQGILDRNSEAVKATLSSSFPLLSSKPVSARLTGSTTFRVAQPRLVLLKDDLDLVAREVDSGYGVSDLGTLDQFSGTFSASASTLATGPPSAATPPSSPFLTVTLLSRLSGRPHLARVAQQLCENLERKGSVKLGEGAVEEVIEATSIAEPDLLLVLGGPYLRLHGFPPWQLRLTEMYHHSSPSWLPPPPLSYIIFRRALDLYGHAEKRLGR